MDEAIAASIRRNHNLVIGESTAERIKVAIGTAQLPADGRGAIMSVKGRDLVHGVPREIEISQSDIAGPLNDLTNQIVEAVILTLTRTEPELAADIYENGIVMTGGGSLLTGIDEVLSTAVGLSVTVAENALLSVAIGAGRALENPIYSQAMAER